jgi:hypothetical protein
MGGSCITREENEICIPNFGLKISREETVWGLGVDYNITTYKNKSWLSRVRR